jgi:hypothetical protein
MMENTARSDAAPELSKSSPTAVGKDGEFASGDGIIEGDKGGGTSLATVSASTTGKTP